MTEPVACGCGGKAAIYINGDTTMQGYCTVCRTVGPVADSTSEAIAAWNTAMGKDLRDAAWEYWLESVCLLKHVNDRMEAALEASRKGAK